MLDQVIVPRIGAGQGVAAHRNRLAGADVLVGKDSYRSAADGNVVRTKLGDGGASAEDRTDRCVIDPVARGEPGDTEICLADISPQPSLLDQVVVPRIGAGKGVAAHRNRLAGADVLVGEDTCRSAADGNVVRTKLGDRSGSAENGTDRCVIDPVAHGKTGDTKICLADVGLQPSLLDQVVVPRIGAGKGVAAHRNRLAGADVLVGKDSYRSAADGNVVRTKLGDGGASAEDRTDRCVIDPVARGEPGDAEIGLADVGRQTGLLDQAVVARIGSGKGVAAHRNRLAGADIFIGKSTDSGPCNENVVRTQFSNRG